LIFGSISDPYLRRAKMLPYWLPPFLGPYLYYPERRLVPTGLRAFVDFIKLDIRVGAPPHIRFGPDRRHLAPPRVGDRLPIPPDGFAEPKLPRRP
jgi:hypothetical protein